MAGEFEVRKLTPEFWAIVGSAIALLAGLIGIAALLLTVAGWIRDDMQSMGTRIDGLDTRLTGEIKALDAKLTGEIKALDTRLTGEIKALDIKLTGEIKALDTKLTGEIKALVGKVGALDKRLAVVESHVLESRRNVHIETKGRTQAL